MPATRFARLAFALVVCIALCIIGRNLYFRYLNNRLVVVVEARSYPAGAKKNAPAGEAEDVAEVRMLLNRGADPNTKKPLDGRTGKESTISLLAMLFDGGGASSAGGSEMVCLLIEHGADIRDDPITHTNYLTRACATGNLISVRCLLEHGANAHAVDSHQVTRVDKDRLVKETYIATLIDETFGFIYRENYNLSTAEHNKDFTRQLGVGKEIIRLLQQKGASLTLWQAVAISDNTALYAALKSHIDLEARDPNKAPSSLQNLTLLEVAAEYGNQEAVQILLQHGASVNGGNKYTANPLAQAIYNGHQEVARLLLTYGADVNAQLRGGWSPLLAASDRLPAMIPELLLRGADLKTQGVAVLCKAMRAKKNDIVTLLLRKGVRCQGKAGRPVLSVAVLYRPDLVPLLLAQGADARETPATKDSLIWEAAHYGREEAIVPLLRAGASINASHNASTPLVEALGHPATLVKLLLEKGADPNKVVDAMPPALGIAAQTGNSEAVKLLLQHGANVNLTGKVLRKGKAGRTPLCYAHKHHHAEIAALLEKAGGKE